MDSLGNCCTHKRLNSLSSTRLRYNMHSDSQRLYSSCYSALPFPPEPLKLSILSLSNLTNHIYLNNNIWMDEIRRSVLFNVCFWATHSIDVQTLHRCYHAASQSLIHFTQQQIHVKVMPQWISITLITSLVKAPHRAGVLISVGRSKNINRCKQNKQLSSSAFT